MSVDDKVVNATTTNCPAGKRGIVTTKVYESGKITYSCSAGTDPVGLSSRPCTVPNIAMCCKAYGN